MPSSAHAPVRTHEHHHLASPQSHHRPHRQSFHRHSDGKPRILVASLFLPDTVTFDLTSTHPHFHHQNDSNTGTAEPSPPPEQASGSATGVATPGPGAAGRPGQLRAQPLSIVDDLAARSNAASRTMTPSASEPRVNPFNVNLSFTSASVPSTSPPNSDHPITASHAANANARHAHTLAQSLLEATHNAPTARRPPALLRSSTQPHGVGVQPSVQAPPIIQPNPSFSRSRGVGLGMAGVPLPGGASGTITPAGQSTPAIPKGLPSGASTPLPKRNPHLTQPPLSPKPRSGSAGSMSGVLGLAGGVMGMTTLGPGAATGPSTRPPEGLGMAMDAQEEQERLEKEKAGGEKDGVKGAKARAMSGGAAHHHGPDRDGRERPQQRSVHGHGHPHGGGHAQGSSHDHGRAATHTPARPNGQAHREHTVHGPSHRHAHPPLGTTSPTAGPASLFRRLSRKRSTSLSPSERLFSGAPFEFTLNPHGNGGLQNAVRSFAASVAAAAEVASPSDGGKEGDTKGRKASSGDSFAQMEDKEIVWVGTVGCATDVLDDKTKRTMSRRMRDERNGAIVYVSDEELEGAYDGYCKQILWGTFHYQIPDGRNLKAYESDTFAQYKAVNEHFAEEIVKNYRKGDIVWINDYHLLLVPQLVRQKLPNAPIGFFLHVSFPSSEIFRCLAVRKELLLGMLGADLIGFQTYNFARHFRQTVSRILQLQTSPKGIQLDDNYERELLALGEGRDDGSDADSWESEKDEREKDLAEEDENEHDGGGQQEVENRKENPDDLETTEERRKKRASVHSQRSAESASSSGSAVKHEFAHVGVFPIGIDVKALNEKRKEQEVEDWVKLLSERYHGKKIIVARDKLDYVKGVKHKLLAFEKFLDIYPQWRGKVVLIQVALATSEENEMQGQVHPIVARVNARFSSLTYQPIVFLHQEVTFGQYLALLTVADAFISCSLRDGMMLTSHEYVVCQEGKYAPLILSEFTGSYTYSGFRSCIPINPWNYKQVADAMNQALAMDNDEAYSRWKDLERHVWAQNGQHWVQTFLQRLERASFEQNRRDTLETPLVDLSLVAPRFYPAKRRLILVGLENVLFQDAQATKNIARMDIPSSVIDLLKRISEQEGSKENAVYVFTGRPPSDLKDLEAAAPKVGIVAEDGCWLKYAGNKDWTSFTKKLNLEWRGAVKEILAYYTERTPGSFVEDRGVSLAWHFQSGEVQDDSEDAQWAKRQAGEVQNHIMDSLGERYGLHIYPSATSFLVIPKKTSRSAAVEHILQHGHAFHSRHPSMGVNGGGIGTRGLRGLTSASVRSTSPAEAEGLSEAGPTTGPPGSAANLNDDADFGLIDDDDDDDPSKHRPIPITSAMGGLDTFSKDVVAPYGSVATSPTSGTASHFVPPTKFDYILAVGQDDRLLTFLNGLASSTQAGTWKSLAGRNSEVAKRLADAIVDGGEKDGVDKEAPGVEISTWGIIGRTRSAMWALRDPAHATEALEALFVQVKA